ncbi:MAG TPA: DUF882 domain-containing protein [Desulfobacterales bacterium]|nr:DUF882 domain-containing protein [Desulfobacterales bacterium]
MNRREALKIILAGGIASSLTPLWYPLATAYPLKSRYSGRLSVHNMHTDESLTVCYLKKNKRFDPSALNQLNHLFRCHYTGKVHHIQPELFLLLDMVRSHLGANERPFQLVSGYRSPEYNRLLRNRSRQVARKSYHLRGMAADIQLEGVELPAVRDAAKCLNMGGVGTYDQFIHLDVGPVRYW